MEKSDAERYRMPALMALAAAQAAQTVWTVWQLMTVGFVEPVVAATGVYDSIYCRRGYAGRGAFHQCIGPGDDCERVSIGALESFARPVRVGLYGPVANHWVDITRHTATIAAGDRLADAL
jgi:hypothetical protein